jgi:hypothetical protein
VARLGQRLSELLDATKYDSAILKKFINVEEKLFKDTKDPMMNWDVETLKAFITEIPRTNIKDFYVSTAHTTRILPAQVDFWFRPSAPQERKSLGGRLQSVFEPDQIEGLKRFFHAQFDKKEVQWKTVIAYFKITRD